MSIFLKFKELMIFVFMIKYHCVLTKMRKSCPLPAAAEGYDNGVWGGGKQGG